MNAVIAVVCSSKYAVFSVSIQLPGGDRSEVLALREEVRQARINLSSWQEQYGKAKQACDAWKREAEDLSQRVQQMERERQQASKEKAEVRAHGQCRWKCSNVNKN